MKTKSKRHTYAAKTGSSITDKDAQIVGRELDRIEKERGCLKPPDIVDEARPENSQLHGFFTWEDSEAAELYRQGEARQLVRSVVIVSLDGQETPESRAFVSVRASVDEKDFDGVGYISTVRALGDNEYKAQVLKNALDELVSFRARYKHLQELAQVVEAIDAVTA